MSASKLACSAGIDGVIPPTLRIREVAEAVVGIQHRDRSPPLLRCRLLDGGVAFLCDQHPLGVGLPLDDEAPQ